jgi:hypothetical protein
MMFFLLSSSSLQIPDYLLLGKFLSTYCRMQVLYISNNPDITKDEAMAWFQFYCDEPDLHIHMSLYEAKEFLTENIIGNPQKHLDFIISDWRFEFENPTSLLTWIRESNYTFSSENFQFRSLPFLLIEDTISQSSSISQGFDGVVAEFPSNHTKLRFAVKDVIKTWRYSLANDLDLIGLDPRTQKIYKKHREAFISYYRLKVLSRHFVDTRSKRLDYIWTLWDIKPINDSNYAFFDKMKKTIENPPRYLEKEFHEFFKANPTFIKGEDFIRSQEAMLYEKHLYKNGTRHYDEADFINKPQDYALRFPEIFEIKRQSQRLIHYQKEKFLSKAMKGFEQVKRYKDYMTSDNPLNQNYIKRYLGQIYPSYEYTLLMGSLNEKLEYEDLIGRLKKDFDFEDINLITYEELLDRHIRLCDRLYEFNIFS